MKELRGSDSARRLAFLVFMIAAILLTACSATNIQEPDLCDDGGMLLSDDFDGSRDCGWQLYSGRGVSEIIENDVLRIESSQPGLIGWALAGREFEDVVINTRINQIGGPDDNAYGIICRYQSPDNYYIFLISGDGHYSIGKFQSGIDDVQYLSGDGNYVPSEVINQGQAENEIQASCIGNQLSLSVNGVLVETVEDPTFVRGDVGLGAGTFQPGTAIIEFEKISVFAP